MDDGQKTPHGHLDFPSYVKLNVFHIPDIFLANPLLLYSLSPYGWTESRTENEYTRFAWAGGTYFSVVLLCQFFVLAGNKFWFYILLMYVHRVPYSCGVVLVFLIWREIVFHKYVLSVQYSCAVVSVFLLWRES